jgi:lipopolysaccharide assembly outer membrane protein LptD (OstA)
LKIKGLLSIEIGSAIFVLLFVFSFVFAQQQKQTVVITGSKMYVKDSGNLILSQGKSKAVDGENIVKADEMAYNKKTALISAQGNVEIITSSGTIYSDNAVFDSKLNTVIMKKDKKRPSADIMYDGKKGYYQADKMTFFNYEKKKILMEGNVSGKIQMEDKKP